MLVLKLYVIQKYLVPEKIMRNVKFLEIIESCERFR